MTRRRFPFGHGRRTAEIAHLAGEFDFIARQLARERDAQIIALGIQQFDKGHRLSVHFAFAELRFALLLTSFHVGLAGQGVPVLLEIERVFLQAALGFEFRFPNAGDVGGRNDAGAGHQGHQPNKWFHVKSGSVSE